MARVVPWPTTAAPGYVNIHWKYKSGGMPGTPTIALDDFMELAQSRPDDAYFCLSQQKDLKLNKYNKPTAHRHHTNVVSFKSIWMDLDVKANAYPSIPEALEALTKFRERYALPPYTALVTSGNGLHVYWISDRVLTPDEWRPYAVGLAALAKEFGLKCDTQCTVNAAQVLRVPGTFNCKKEPKKPVKLLHLGEADLDFASLASVAAVVPTITAAVIPAAGPLCFDPAIFPKKPTPAGGWKQDDLLSAGTGYEVKPLDWKPMLHIGGCPLLRHRMLTGGVGQQQGEWMNMALAYTFVEGGQQLFHTSSSKYIDGKTYDKAEVEAMWQRKLSESSVTKPNGLRWPSCATFEDNGADQICKLCPHYKQIKSPLNLAARATTPDAPTIPPNGPGVPIAFPQPFFVDPYSEFVGPPFPLDVLPPTLAKFVGAEHRAMGADPSAIAMAVLAVVAGAAHAQTCIRAGEGWWEKPILWIALIGLPSSMKSPIVDKAVRPLARIDQERSKLWQQEYAKWRRDNPKSSNQPAPAKPPRGTINDATPEKVAEILSRHPSGSLMVHDELAGWLGGFERYSSGGASRAFYLSGWNGGEFLKDRVGKGGLDVDAEIRLENFALCILGGIQPDRLAKIRDLTSDGLLQRIMPVLMSAAERGDEYHPVDSAERDYEALIRSINAASPQRYHFADDALEVRDRMIDKLHKLEQVDGFSTALIGAIGKLKGYFARICLVLEIAQSHDPVSRNERFLEVCPFPDQFPAKPTGTSPIESLREGIFIGGSISRRTAEAAEKIINEFLLPHNRGLYDEVVNGGQDRDMIRSVGDFILSSDKKRLRPSDITAGVRALRGQTDQKIREWIGRFCAMGWLQPEEQERFGASPKAWLVEPGLREHFAERRKQAQAARAVAHAILKAGGSRKAAKIASSDKSS
jgi:hypothetical protein